jgi:hypothetical protein
MIYSKEWKIVVGSISLTELLFPIFREHIFTVCFLYEPCVFEFAEAASNSKHRLTSFACDFFWS